MIKKFGRNKILWFITALLSLIVSLAGVANPNLYHGLISADNLPGALSQDLVTVAASVLLLFLILKIKEEQVTKQIIVLGIVGYLFYGYGIYVVERVYNVLYFLYMAILGLSFYALVYGVGNIRKEISQKVKVPKAIRNLSIAFLVLVPVIFYPLWISKILPLIQTGQKIEFGYSIFILDMCFVLPLFLMVSVMLAKKDGLGILIAPALFIKGLTLCVSVALGELLKPFYHLRWDVIGAGLFIFLSLASLTLAILYFKNLKINTN